MNADSDTVRGVVGDMPTDAQVAVAVESFRMLSDATRVRVLWILLQGERSVGELAALLDARPSAVSQHLSKLRLAGLVTTRRSGNHIFYTADDGHLSLLLREALHHADHVAQALPAHEANR